jgi:hypothetical protein
VNFWFRGWRYYAYHICLGRPGDPDKTVVCNTSPEPMELFFGAVSLTGPTKPEPDVIIGPFEKYEMPNYKGEITLIWRP